MLLVNVIISTYSIYRNSVNEPQVWCHHGLTLSYFMATFVLGDNCNKCLLSEWLIYHHDNFTDRRLTSHSSLRNSSPKAKIHLSIHLHANSLQMKPTCAQNIFWASQPTNLLEFSRKLKNEVKEEKKYQSDAERWKMAPFSFSENPRWCEI